MPSDMVVQRSEAWYQERLGKVTASCFNKILSYYKSNGNAETAERAKYKTTIVLERVNKVAIEDQYINWAMQRGVEMEPVARNAYILATGNDVNETGFWKHPELEAGASPDGLILEDGLLEPVRDLS